MNSDQDFQNSDPGSQDFLFHKLVQALVYSISGMLGMPAVSFDYGLVQDRSTTHRNTPSETLADIFGAILHYKVPRNRRSLERRLSRKHGEHYMQHARPKKNIVTCLSCGQPHEAETICGKKYSKTCINLFPTFNKYAADDIENIRTKL